jgi:deoxyribodipyrimidine photolyase
MAPVSIYWFRKALRLHDSPSLQLALKNNGNNGNLLFLFCLDPHFQQQLKVGSNRWEFLYVFTVIYLLPAYMYN